MLATTVTSTEGLQRAALRYSLAGTREGLTTWGPEYLRNITREIISEYEARQESYLANASTEGAPALELEVTCVFGYTFEQYLSAVLSFSFS